MTEKPSISTPRLDENSHDGGIIPIVGETPTDTDGNLIGANDMAAQTHAVFENVKRRLEHSGVSLRHLVKLTVYVTDIDQLPVVREITDEYCDTKEPPRRLEVPVTTLSFDGQMIEVDAFAVMGK